MIRIFIISLISILYLAGWQEKAILADSLSDDEAAIAAHIKALHDEKSEVRETAAKALRLIVAKYPNGTSNIRSNDNGEAYWMEKADQVQIGMTKAEVAKILPPFPESPDGMGMGSGQSHFVSYRLDAHWMVTIYYRNPDKVLQRPKLSRRELLVYVAPPANYTGKWINWYVNGQKGHETEYKGGKYNGLLTHYHDNGHKNYEQHYTNHVIDGADTGWYSDGKKSYTAQYRNGKQDGKWIHWYPNGNKKSESNYKNGEYDGLYAGWYENGQMRFEMNYKNGIKHGVDAAWNEQGVLQYKRETKMGRLSSDQTLSRSNDTNIGLTRRCTRPSTASYLSSSLRFRRHLVVVSLLMCQATISRRPLGCGISSPYFLAVSSHKSTASLILANADSWVSP